MVVIHYTAMRDADSALQRLCDPDAEVSAHYLIGAQGDVIQMVDEVARAWHAGAGEWGGVDDINSRSIGIELDNRGNHPFSAPQVEALEVLLRGIMTRWDIRPDSVIGHSDMAPGRKTDPGPYFDWARLERQGLAARRRAFDASAVTEDAFVAAAQAAGYTAPSDFTTLLHTTRLRHAPWRTGALSAADFTL
ncbi:N-acetylmuramoyl-L-alanine amidase [Sulfitobacter undariae]|uniref:N-acetylmuramoyl-L-alanine amidase n=1 Tax=Sulfitobacter undariae TaxID=1563671 RepID=A0A7W6E2D7_9RHOB|nr:N-acetylmuramoyl-L-alanine amidase [Sulfitobacter undariae]MBB3993475.1 N-acetylmuramoyl-L-alanine amidase [Sulfitobacter undariae]